MSGIAHTLNFLKRAGRAAASKPWRLSLFVIAIGSALSFLLYLKALPDVEYLKTQNPKTTALIEIRRAQAASRGEDLVIRQRWVSYRTIPTLLLRSVRLSEDAAFYHHRGVDYRELWESVKKDLRERRFARGASTITQQLAKNLYLSPRKTITRKIKEIFIVKRLEKHLTKARILHLYLNVIELGPGVFGVEAASRYYFGKSVADLDLEEIVRLTAIIPRPLTVSPHSNSAWMKRRAVWILDRLLASRYITADEYHWAVRRFR